MGGVRCLGPGLRQWKQTGRSFLDERRNVLNPNNPVHLTTLKTLKIMEGLRACTIKLDHYLNSLILWFKYLCRLGLVWKCSTSTATDTRQRNFHSKLQNFKFIFFGQIVSKKSSALLHPPRGPLRVRKHQQRKKKRIPLPL